MCPSHTVLPRLPGSHRSPFRSTSSMVNLTRTFLLIPNRGLPLRQGSSSRSYPSPDCTPPFRSNHTDLSLVFSRLLLGVYGRHCQYLPEDPHLQDLPTHPKTVSPLVNPTSTNPFSPVEREGDGEVPLTRKTVGVLVGKKWNVFWFFCL